MKISTTKKLNAGYVSYVLVLSIGAVLSLLAVGAYRGAMNAQAAQAQVQLRVDYSEKEESILRSIVAITPNRAIRAMQSGSNDSNASRAFSTWETIFSEALTISNARNSIDPRIVTALNIPGLRMGNTGDSALTTPSRIFAAVAPDTLLVSEGMNRNFGTGYPPALTCSDTTTITRDEIYPIISRLKRYGSLAQTHLNDRNLNGDGSSGYGVSVTNYPDFNRLAYPRINFGYARPGDPFVAKRNWWAFSMDVADHDDNLTFLARSRRNFVLSIYEIPSQLAISASSFMSLGQYTGGSAWENVTVSGPVFAGRAEVLGSTQLDSLNARRGLTLSNSASIGGQTFSNNNPFTPGTREAFQLTSGQFLPVSVASESGHAAFVPINRGPDYFDRFAHATATNVLSTTEWNDYSVGALQCAMRLDVTRTTSATNLTPTEFRFGYLLPNGTRASMPVALNTSMIATTPPVARLTTLPPGFVEVAVENSSFTFPGVVDVAYGQSGGFTFRQGVSGTITFNNATFGDPLVGTVKRGYWRPPAPFELRNLASGQQCVALYPERIPSFLTVIGAATTALNHSIVVNVDYTVTGLNNSARRPNTNPCLDSDYGLIMRECANLAGFSRGFSLVTNLRLYIGDDFNTVAATPPSGYSPAGLYFPPCSLFAPEKRYGVDLNPFNIVLSGQVGSLARETDPAVRPLDSKNLNGAAMPAANIRVNLRPITHPAELPPVTMMNWLILLEERRREFF
jgi:hypothetical protein